MTKYLLAGALVLLAIIAYTQTRSPKEATVVTTPVAETTDDTNQSKMSFFVTSKNPGNGADFGGLSGADAHCQSLAEATGSDLTWAAYLSVTETDTQNIIDARDRIGTGPWHNATGELIANDIEDLHNNNKFSKALALNENGEIVNGRGDTPNQHDILTGSNSDGTLALGEEDTTCSNWTSSDKGSAFVGHHDRMGLDESDGAKSWNSSHGSRGCSLENLRGTGGEGLIYCFAI